MCFWAFFLIPGLLVDACTVMNQRPIFKFNLNLCWNIYTHSRLFITTVAVVFTSLLANFRTSHTMRRKHCHLFPMSIHIATYSQTYFRIYWCVNDFFFPRPSEQSSPDQDLFWPFSVSRITQIWRILDRQRVSGRRSKDNLRKFGYWVSYKKCEWQQSFMSFLCCSSSFLYVRRDVLTKTRKSDDVRLKEKKKKTVNAFQYWEKEIRVYYTASVMYRHNSNV